MTQRFLSYLFIIVTVLASTLSFAQVPADYWKPHFRSIPLHGATRAKAMNDSLAGATLPLWTYTQFSSKDGNTYNTTLMGSQPNLSLPSFINQTTNLTTVIIPLVVTMPDSGDIFDPTANAIDPSCNLLGRPSTITQQSPLFNDSLYTWGGTTVGNTQYIDAFQRAEFWSDVGVYMFSKTSALGYRVGTYDWHTRFSPVTTIVPQYFYPTQGLTYYFGTCGEIGVLDINEVQHYVEQILLPQLQSQGLMLSTSLPVILMENVVESENSFLNCCVLGFHSAYLNAQLNTQFYSLAEYDTTTLFGNGATDVSVLSHELGEAVNDPTGLNATPPWGNVGQVVGCQANFEVGDPLTGTLMPSLTMNGFTYHLQELAFYSWFYGSPSHGVNGWYSSNKSFPSQAAVCP